MADPVDSRIGRVAGPQQRNITREQFLVLGLHPKAIDYRIGVGRLYRVHSAVYSVGGPPRLGIEYAAAAVLAAGPDAVLSHQSALALWGFAKRWPRPVEVTTTADRRPRGITVHRSTTLTRAERTRHHGIAVTTPARSIFDSALSLGGRLAQVVNDALLSPHLKRHQLAEVCRLHPHHPSPRSTSPRGEPTRSPWEREFPAFCAYAKLPQPLIGHRIGRRTVDALFAEERLIVELDGWGSHSSRDRFENDRDRDADHLALGLPTIRITKARIKHARDAEAARLRRILARRRSELGLPPRPEPD